MDNDRELAKSRAYTIKNGTLIMADQSGAFNRQPAVQLNGMIDKKYQILGLVGEGGMGAVYRAHHLLLNKDVALKTFKSASLTEEDRKRFHREVQAIAKLKHNNVVSVFDFGLTEASVPYYTMEFLTGQSMAERIKNSGPLPVDQAVPFFVQVCEALAEAHSKGIIHRDLKPANLFIESRSSPKASAETIKIVDFGIAGLAGQEAGGQKITISGTIFGSPLYMSPEQACGGVISTRSDIYSMGCSLFEVLIGTPPFFGPSPLDTIMMHHNTPPPTLKEASDGKEFSPALEHVVATMLAKSPDDRQQTMKEVAAQLEQFMPPKHDTKAGQRKTGERAKKTGDYEKKSSESINGVSAAVNGVAPRNKNRGSQTDKASDNDKDSDKDADTELVNDGLSGQTILRQMPVFIAIVVIVIVGVALFLSWSENQKARAPELARPAPQSAPASVTPALPPELNPESAPGQKFDLRRKSAADPSGTEHVTFTFPSDRSLGDLVDRHKPKRKIKASGEVTWALDNPYIFIPCEEFLRDPDNINNFQASDLWDLDLRRALTYQKDSRLMQRVCRLTGLRELNVSEGDLGNADLKEIDQLKKLQGLQLRHTAITGGALAKISQLRLLKQLNFSRCKDVGELLPVLKDGRIQVLNIADNPMVASDFKAVSALSSLRSLQLNGCNVNDQALVDISSLPELKHLYCQHGNYTAAALAPIEKMAAHGLIDLDLSESVIPLGTQNKIKKLLPHATMPSDRAYDPDWTTLGNHPVAE